MTAPPNGVAQCRARTRSIGGSDFLFPQQSPGSSGRTAWTAGIGGQPTTVNVPPDADWPAADGGR